MNLRNKKKVYASPQMDVVQMVSCVNLLQGSNQDGSNTNVDDDMEFLFNFEAPKNDKAQSLASAVRPNFAFLSVCA